MPPDAEHGPQHPRVQCAAGGRPGSGGPGGWQDSSICIRGLLVDMRDPGQRQRPLLGEQPERKDWPGNGLWLHWRRRRRDGRRPGYSGARHRADGLLNQRRILPRMRTPRQPQHSMLGAQRTRADRDRYEQRRRYHGGDGGGPGYDGLANDQVILCLLRMVLLMRDNPGRHGQVLGRKLRREAGGLRWRG